MTGSSDELLFNSDFFGSFVLWRVFFFGFVVLRPFGCVFFFFVFSLTAFSISYDRRNIGAVEFHCSSGGAQLQ
jgi:hypothetical protein